jgi:hypothetical protein
MSLQVKFASGLQAAGCGCNGSASVFTLSFAWEILQHQSVMGWAAKLHRLQTMPATMYADFPSYVLGKTVLKPSNSTAFTVGHLMGPGCCHRQ